MGGVGGAPGCPAGTRVVTPFAYDLLALLGAVAFAGIGGELFLKGVLSAATALRVPRLLVATGIAAFGC